MYNHIPFIVIVVHVHVGAGLGAVYHWTPNVRCRLLLLAMLWRAVRLIVDV